MFSPEPPQGFTSEQSQVVILRQPIPLFSPPQRRRGPPPDGETFRVKVTYPQAATGAFDFFRFYQINKNQVPSLQTDMPLVIIDSLPAGSILEGAGLDVRMFDSSGNAIPYESIDITLLGGGAADIEIYFKMPTVAAGEFVQLAFGNATATDDSNPNGVYDANYKAVLHLNQTIFGTNSIIDSTVNGNDCTDVGAGAISSVVGPVGKAIRFASESGISCGTTILDDMNDVGTISMWVNIDDILGGPASQTFYALVSGSNRWEALIQSTQGDILFRYGGQSIDIDIQAFVGDGENHLWTFTWDQPNSQARIYIDGVIIAENNTPWTLATSVASLVMGNVPALVDFTTLIGFEDEARFSNIIRDSDWILTEFNNQNDQDAFWFKSPILTVSQNNFLVDDLGNNIVTEIP